MIMKPVYRNSLNSVFTSLVLLCFGTMTLAEEKPQPQAEYSKGARQCMTCHSEGKDPAAHEIFMNPMGISKAPKSPFAEGSHDCETCHGPSASHRKKQKDGSRLPPTVSFSDHDTTASKNNVCLTCHNNSSSLSMHWPGSVHEEEEVACSDCHEVHAERDRVRDSLSQQEVCFSCHPRTRSETFRASSHPLRFGEMTCTDCHNPHDGTNDALLKRSNINDTCYECHAEKRGPFLWEHAPVTEDCTLCHNPHGSNHAALLKQRSPLLCQQCHAPAGHPVTAYTTEVAEDSFQQRFLLARSCTNCHAQVHGSNHPSGVTITR